MKIVSRIILGLGLMLPLFFPQSSMAQTYPNHPIQMVITLAAGDSLDLNGRAIGAELSNILNTPVIAVNKAGAGGTVGVDFVAKGKKDGYTILYTNSSFVYTYALNPQNIPYNPFQDLEPLCSVASVPFVLATQADAPWKGMGDLVDYIHKNPGKVRGSTSGVGSIGHLGYEVIRAETGASITMVPFKGGSPGLTALLGGHVDVGTFAMSFVLPQLEAGKVRFLLTSKKIPKLPNVLTLKEMGYRRDMSSVWFGFLVPTGVPESAKKILTSAIEKSIKSANLISINQRFGILEEYKGAEEFKKMMSEDYEMAKESVAGGAVNK